MSSQALLMAALLAISTYSVDGMIPHWREKNLVQDVFTESIGGEHPGE
jgi:hypothetical protein